MHSIKHDLKEVASRIILCLKGLSHQRVGFVDESSPLFGNQVEIERIHIFETQATLWFRGTKFVPGDPANHFGIVDAIPPKRRNYTVKIIT